MSRAEFSRDYPANKDKLEAVKRMVVYCTSRQCEESSIVATKLLQRGFRNIAIFEGGWDEARDKEPRGSPREHCAKSAGG